MNPEIYEYLEEVAKCPNCPEMTPSNLKALESRKMDKLASLEANYANGGHSPRKTHLHFAQNYADVDIGYGSYVND